MSIVCVKIILFSESVTVNIQRETEIELSQVGLEWFVSFCAVSTVSDTVSVSQCLILRR